jgi:hypothetical protein
MQVNNRSNDIVWGAYGANAVHMSMMMEYVARMVGVEVGVYYQSSWNFHAYTDVYPTDRWLELGTDAMRNDMYSQGLVKPYPLVQVAEPAVWTADAKLFCEGADKNFNDPMFYDVAVPMLRAWRAHKDANYTAAIDYADSIAAHDWRLACKAWLTRRAEKRRMKQMEEQSA